MDELSEEESQEFYRFLVSISKRQGLPLERVIRDMGPVLPAKFRVTLNDTCTLHVHQAFKQVPPVS
jgi:hypothetical protein